MSTSTVGQPSLWKGGDSSESSRAPRRIGRHLRPTATTMLSTEMTSATTKTMYAADAAPSTRRKQVCPPSPSMTADEWWAGANAPPRTAPLDPAKAGNGASTVAKTFTKVKTAAQLQKELDEALAKIARLEKKLADAGLSAE